MKRFSRILLLLSLSLPLGNFGMVHALQSTSANFRNARSLLSSAGSTAASASFFSANTLGDVSLTTHTSANYQVRSGLIPVYFYPGKITGLFASSGPVPGTIYLQWNAPGNDAQAAGTSANRYLVRISSDPASSPALSDTLFNAASAVTPTPPAPATQGSAQSMTVSNLTAGDSYYFALKGTEADGLEGVLSDGVTAYAHIVAPGVFALTFTGISTGSYTLYWTSGTPATDYNPQGTRYVAQVSPDPSFNTAVLAVQTTSLHTLVSGLDPNTTYYARSAAYGNAVTTTRTPLGGASTLANVAQDARLVCRVSQVSATAAWLPMPLSPSSATAEGFSFEISTTSDFSGTVLSSITTTASVNNLTIDGLSATATYYYRVGSFNWNFLANYTDLQGAGLPLTPPLFARTGFKVAMLHWDALPSAGACSVVGFNIYRSSTSPSEMALLTTTTSTALTDAIVSVGSTYYYQLTGMVAGGLETLPSQASLVFVHSAPPVQPFGVKITTFSPTTVTLSWLPVPAYDNGFHFSSYYNPAPDELVTYRVLRATTPVRGTWTSVASVSSTTCIWNDTTSGPQYYYRVQAANTTDISNASIIISQGDRSGYVLAPDDRSTLRLSPQMVEAISGNGEDPDSAYLLQISSHPEDLGPAVLKSLEITASKGGVQLDPTMQLASLGHLDLHYDFDASGTGVTPSAFAGPKPVTPDRLSVFWNNGARWLQLYGQLNAADQSMNIEVKNLGRYQLRSVARPASFNVDPSGVSNRLITPNGDGRNDNSVVFFTNDSCSQVTGKIFDLKGAAVASMSPGPTQYDQSPGCTGSLMWDGKAGGAAVPGGVYIYQIEGEGKAFTGTFVVIK